MSAAPEAPAAAAPGEANPPLPKPAQMMRSCWSCKVLSGGGLILAGAYVLHAARKVMKQGGPTTMGIVAQITFALSLASWGTVILVDPVGKAERKA